GDRLGQGCAATGTGVKLRHVAEEIEDAHHVPGRVRAGQALRRIQPAQGLDHQLEDVVDRVPVFEHLVHHLRHQARIGGALQVAVDVADIAPKLDLGHDVEV